MSFRLLIECSKEINELHINFADGTSSVVHKEPEDSIDSKELKSKEKVQKTSESKVKKEPREPKEPRKSLETYLDTEEDYEVQQEVVQKPVIAEIDRPAKVSDELQNLDL